VVRYSISFSKVGFPPSPLFIHCTLQTLTTCVFVNRQPCILGNLGLSRLFPCRADPCCWTAKDRSEWGRRVRGRSGRLEEFCRCGWEADCLGRKGARWIGVTGKDPATLYNLILNQTSQYNTNFDGSRRYDPLSSFSRSKANPS
jgi:hypothetical protein